MPFTPGFENDIFISYCHYDNVAFKGEPGWVDCFHESLEISLLKRLGHKKVSIWRDKKLQGSTLFDSHIKEQIRKSALFLALISPNYLKSDYCRQELEWFHNDAAKSLCGLSINNECRIFPVLLRNIRHDLWPQQLIGASGFPMHDQPEVSENPGESLDYREFQYNKKLCKILDAVEALLKLLPASGADCGDGKRDEPEALLRLESGISAKEPGRVDVEIQKGICPFRGLEAFREQDRRFFFGRDDLARRLLDKLCESRFLAVIGPSGCGKSSVVQAGLIASLRERFVVSLFTPRERPIEELAFTLRKCYPEKNIPPVEQLIKRLEQGGETLHYIAREMVEFWDNKKLLVVIDQFEELFTQTGSDAERERFISLILDAVDVPDGPVTIILTMRSDFIGKCAFYKKLNKFVTEHLVQVEPMGMEGLRLAVEEPAAMVGIHFEDGLVNRVLADVKGAPGELPLLELALLELYERRREGLLSLQAYENIGGIAGALVNRAETEFNRLDDPGKEILRKMFLLRLIQPGEGTEDTCRRVSKNELLALGADIKLAEKVLNQWIDARLLTSTQDTSRGQDLVDVAHEALIRKWDRVQEWMAAGRESARLMGILRQAVLEWNRSDRGPDFLFQGTRLGQMEKLMDAYDGDFTEEEIEFVIAGVKQREAKELEKVAQMQIQVLQQQKALRLTRLVAMVITIALIITSWLAYLAVKSEKEAKRRTLESNYNLARLFDEKAMKAFESGQDNNDTDSYKKAWLYMTAALRQNIHSRDLHMRPDSAGLLLTPRVVNGAFRERWVSPASNVPSGAITTVLFSPDGKTIISGSSDKTIRVWDRASKKVITTLIGHISYVTSVAISPDGKTIVSGSTDKTIRLWDRDTKKKIAKFIGHTSDVTSVAFSLDGRTIASSSNDNTIRLWDKDAIKSIAVLMGHTDAVTSVVFSPDSKTVASGSEDKTIRLWDRDSQKEIAALMGHTDTVTCVVFSPDGKIIVSGSDDHTIRLWDRNSQKEIAALIGYSWPVNSIAFSPDGKTIASGYYDNTIRLWDRESKKEIAALKGHLWPVNSVAFSPDGKTIVSGSDDQTIRLWDKWYIDTKKEIGILAGNTDKVTCVAFSPDGNTIASGSEDHTIRLLDGNSQKEIASLWGHSSPVTSVAFSPDGKIIASVDKSIRLWDRDSQKEIAVLAGHTDKVTCVTFSPDGKTIVSGSEDHAIRLWDRNSQKEIAKLTGHSDMVACVTFSPDSKTIASGSKDRTIRLWDREAKKEIAALTGHSNEVISIAFSFDGRILASGSCDNTIRLWDMNVKKVISKLMGHSNWVTAVAFSPDGKTIVSGSRDSTIRLWDRNSQKEIATFTGHYSVVSAVAFSADGMTITSGSLDKTIRSWDLHIFNLFLKGGRPTPLFFSFAEGVEFFWGFRLEGFEYKSVGHPDDFDKKFRPLLDEPAPDQTKFEQILQWAER